ncbi:hypothetical protein PR002_g26882 [Phytophthora rubi]|uniref:Xaa-Pro dipeptidyl-peptidase-like domain-containing protein n=1 Tax=Phytophthora rubi TaxID=129364 RepID=A0A6A3HNP5_9STRA|nr:hypothetical protein PR002_g26882 [Phytophthora rubi]
MAQRSFAEIRVGIRGSDNSEDHYYEEYTLQELQDGVKVIQWLAAQSWCPCRAGVFGKGGGGMACN